MGQRQRGKSPWAPANKHGDETGTWAWGWVRTADREPEGSETLFFDLRRVIVTVNDGTARAGVQGR